MLLSLLSVTLDYLVGKWMVPLSEEMQLVVYRQLIQKLSTVPVSFFNDTEAYNRVEAAAQQVRALPGVLDNLFQVFSAILTLVLLIPILATFDILSVGIILLMSVPILFLQYQLRKDKFNVSKEILRLDRKKMDVMAMLVNKFYAGEIRIFHLFPWLYGKFEAFGKAAIQKKEANNTHQMHLSFGVSGISLFTVSVLQIIFISKALAGAISIGQYTMYNTYVLSFQSAVNSLIQSLMNLYERKIFLQNLTGFLNDDSLHPRQTLPDDTSPVPAEPTSFRIDFVDVSFSYRQGMPVLSHLNLTVEAGKTLAIVGLNGAGKSTIFSLILRFYEPDEGKILLNGVDITSIPIETYWSWISVVFQNPMIYPFTLEENITFTQKLPDSVSQRKWVDDLIRKYPKGLNTVLLPYLDKEGISPSDGEIQRIALARALYKKRGILLLDEPTSAMDAEVEYYLFQDFREICQNQTSIIISHRLSSATMADNIILLEKGHITESGTHEALMAQNGTYARLFKMQSEKYVASL